MTTERRGSPRQPVHQSARIAVFELKTLADCAMSDLSSAGARLRVDPAADIPNRFLLLLSEDGSVRRLCEIIWRQNDQMGIKFLDSDVAPSGTHHAVLRDHS